MQRSHLIICALLLGLAGGLVYLLGRGLGKSRIPHPLIGKPAPSIEQADWLQSTAELAQGQAVILNFWASWCMACRQESFLLERMWQRHRDKLAVVGLAVHDKHRDARVFADRYGKNYPLALDVAGKIGIDYGLTGVPETFIIDRQGVVRFHTTGEVSQEFLRQALNL
ncbi:MAG: TlpA disulfide reductase family protein [Pseudomonadota bacterium]|nr:TlpA disulfide reductase family protein [Pseudomonadota bacterium]